MQLITHTLDVFFFFFFILVKNIYLCEVAMKDHGKKIPTNTEAMPHYFYTVE